MRLYINEALTDVDKVGVLKTTPAPTGVANCRIWHFARDGVYSVKSAYHLSTISIIEDMPEHRGMHEMEVIMEASKLFISDYVRIGWP